ncbi:MAG: helix-turn-helix transcriptional regulator, partial [Myxococcales bacterium]|nr:helix-turn-helix transcriptional regulator [Myxococcales bacterium]
MPYPAQIDPKTLGERALAVAESRGWGAWTLRDVARALGVTANALYRHMGDRAGLEIAIGEAAVRALQASLRAPELSAGAGADADANVVALARRFLAFTAARPHAFTAFVSGKPSLERPAHQAWIGLWREVRG